MGPLKKFNLSKFWTYPSLTVIPPALTFQFKTQYFTSASDHLPFYDSITLVDGPQLTELPICCSMVEFLKREPVSSKSISNYAGLDSVN